MCIMLVAFVTACSLSSHSHRMPDMYKRYLAIVNESATTSAAAAMSQALHAMQ